MSNNRLGTGDAVGDAFISIANITGSDLVDDLSGGKGNHVLVGGFGDDELTSGGGYQPFVFANNFGQDAIKEFNAGNLEDIDLSAVAGIIEFDDQLADYLYADAVTGFAEIHVDTNTILLEGITVGEIGYGGGTSAFSQADFFF